MKADDTTAVVQDTLGRQLDAANRLVNLVREVERSSLGARRTQMIRHYLQESHSELRSMGRLLHDLQVDIAQIRGDGLAILYAELMDSHERLEQSLSALEDRFGLNSEQVH